MMKIDYSNYYWQDELVRLRALQPEDWQLNMQMEFDSVARRRLQYEQELPPTEENRKAATEGFANFKPESGRLMFVIETLDGKPVGIFNLNSIDERHGTFSIGMQIFPAECGKGYGTAAMRILLRYAFDERRLHKYYGSVIEDNIASATMLGLKNTFNEVYPQLQDIDFREDATSLDLPVYLISGRNDSNAPTWLTEEYFNWLEAPAKQLIYFEDSGHGMIWQEADRFYDVMVNTVLAETYFENGDAS